ncbi:Ribosomal RNA small subunit methyltransferase [Trichinella spiralis]|uniref:Ribosomal RNA small subunit methyltransferase n=1 Tax=Trichinella spiralis TaxID=6334 RepID=A0ABR3L410_TRISP
MLLLRELRIGIWVKNSIQRLTQTDHSAGCATQQGLNVLKKQQMKRHAPQESDFCPSRLTVVEEQVSGMPEVRAMVLRHPCV